MFHGQGIRFPISFPNRRLALVLICGLVCALDLILLPDRIQVSACAKVVLASLFVGAIPGMLLLLLVRPGARIAMLEFFGIGVASSFALTRLFTFASLGLHIPVSIISVLVWSIGSVGLYGGKIGGSVFVMPEDESVARDPDQPFSILARRK